jgi:nucleoside-diphosphate-sugar epimerase
MRYLVTGGAGFIGSSIVRGLLNLGFEVTVLDDFSSGRAVNLSEIRSRVSLVEGSVLDLALLDEIMDNVQFVIHQAAIPSVPVSINRPIESHNANATGTLNLLECSRKHKIKRFVYASSSSVYGDSPTLPKREDMEACPRSPYAVNKLCGEHYCRIYYELHQLETVCLRYFNVFGPRQDPESQYSAVIPKFIHSFVHNKAPVIFGDGNQSRDFTYVEDVVEANLLACSVEGVEGSVFNVGSGKEPITVNQLVEKLQGHLGSDLQAEYQPVRPGDVKHSQADIGLISSKMNFEPRFSFDEGLKRTIAWMVTG